MSRPLRIEYPDAWYHVSNRGYSHAPILPGAAERKLFLDVLAETADRFTVEIHAYCLLDNQFHVLMRTPRGNLAVAMRHLGGVFTQRINRERSREGPVFRGRYRAILIDPGGYAARTSRYIHLLPVREGTARSARAWRWSSYRAMTGEQPAPAWLSRKETLAAFGRRQPETGFKTYIRDGVDAETEAFYTAPRRGAAFGGDAFLRRTVRRLGSRIDDPETPEARRLLPRPAIDHILEATAAAFRVEHETLFQERRGRGGGNLPRTVAMALARNPGQYTLIEIARAFGATNYSTVSIAARRLERQMAADDKLARRVARLRRALMKPAATAAG